MTHRLKPMAASWQTWGQVFSNLQQKEQIIHGMEMQLQEYKQQLDRIQREVHLKEAELQRVYATRSWRFLRRMAQLWRGNPIQAGLTHG